MPTNWLMSCLFGLALTSSAVAAPPTKLVSVEVSKDRHARLRMGDLTVATEEPGGLLVPNDVGAEYTELGLQAGDLIRYVNGSAADERLRVSEGPLVMDIVRAGKPVLIHVMVREETKHTVHLDDEAFVSMQDTANRGPLSTPMTVKGKPSGVRITDIVIGIHIRLEPGDIVRKVGGRVILTDAELVDALRTLPVGKTTLMLDRNDQPHTIEIERDAPVELSTITAAGKNKYRVLRGTAAALGAAPGMMMRGVEVVPVAHDGVAHGQRLFKIDPTSIAAKVGLQVDDVVLDVDGHSLDGLMEAYEAVSNVQSNDEITLHLERKGKKLDLVIDVVDR